jgi:hypothetical protein
MMLSSTSRFILANFFTPSYRILGRVQVGNSGLIGLMNDPNTSSIEVTQVSLARLQEPKVITERLNEIRLVKRSILLIGLGRENEVGPSVVARAGYGRVDRHRIRGISGTFEVRGDVEWAGRFDLATLLLEGGDFMPIYDATLQAIQYPDLRMRSPAVLFNRRKMDIISLSIDEPEE